ncbi:MAG: hypothetical protein H6738_22290 [Alphaproteobacteria bacterium]|nr:hypothetical protein [Alphaproteobacteria bacterium]MCB9699530.1 hypothetical protein [Alphaproteobacteria bacterium]
MSTDRRRDATHDGPNPRLKLRPSDLFHRDLVEIVEREARRYELCLVTDPDDPLFDDAYTLLSEGFDRDELETAEALRGFLRDDPYEPLDSGTYLLYFLIVARDPQGRACGVRDGVVLVHPQLAPDLCVVYLARLYVPPWARGTALSYWLRSAPVEVAASWLHGLHERGALALPRPDDRRGHYGMRLDLVAEMSWFTPLEPMSWQRLLWYGRGGFDALSPRDFPYLQPDFRDPEEVAATGQEPLPYMLVVRRVDREQQATMPLDEATAVMRLLYDDFESFCAPEVLATSLQRVLDRLADPEVAAGGVVELLPLPTGPEELDRLIPLFEVTVYDRYYRGSSPFVDEELASEQAREALAHPEWLRERLDAIAAAITPEVHGPLRIGALGPRTLG